jgi:hypothetical protein
MLAAQRREQTGLVIGADRDNAAIPALDLQWYFGPGLLR